MGTPPCDGGEVIPDFDRCYRAVQAKDARFDGWFFAPCTTHRHLLPAELPGPHPEARRTCASSRPRPPRSAPGSGPASGAGPTPRPARPSGTRAATSSAGRCASSPTAWSTARAWPGSPRRLGVQRTPARTGCSWPSSGAGPLALARAQRAQTARRADRDDRPAVRRRRVRGRLREHPPVQRHGPRGVRRDAQRELRTARRPVPPCRAGSGHAPPRGADRRSPATTVLAFLGPARCAGIEAARRTAATSRSLALPDGTAVARPHDRRPDARRATLRLADLRDLRTRSRGPAGCSTSMPTRSRSTRASARDPVLRPLVRAAARAAGAGAVPTARAPACRAVVGQQVSVAGARTVARAPRREVRRAARLPEPLGLGHAPVPERRDPGGDRSGRAPDARGRAPRARRCAAAAIADGVDRASIPGADRDAAPGQLLALPGIGPWTADYVMMRALGDPDVFLATDLGVRRALEAHVLEVAPRPPPNAPGLAARGVRTPKPTSGHRKE